MEILKEYLNISLYQPFGVHIKKIPIKNEFIFEPEGAQAALIINESNDYIWFGITNDIYNTRHFKLVENFLSKKTLEEFSTLFKFNLEKSSYGNYLISFVTLKEKRRISPLIAGFQTYKNRYYILIYSTYGSLFFENNTVYIHGVWEINLSEKLKKKFDLI